MYSTVHFKQVKAAKVHDYETTNLNYIWSVECVWYIEHVATAH